MMRDPRFWIGVGAGFVALAVIAFLVLEWIMHQIQD